jgi:hypothetical protein
MQLHFSCSSSLSSVFFKLWLAPIASLLFLAAGMGTVFAPAKALAHPPGGGELPFRLFARTGFHWPARRARLQLLLIGAYWYRGFDLKSHAHM